MADLENKMLIDSYWDDEEEDIYQELMDEYEREAAIADEMYDLMPFYQWSKQEDGYLF